MGQILEIKKRDGRTVPFDAEKITDAISKAFHATYREPKREVAEKLSREVVARLLEEEQAVPAVEHVQDIVESVLMDDL